MRAAAICASMSPTTRSEARILSRRICQTASFLHAAVVDLDRLELQALGIGVDGIDDAAAAGRERADIEMVRGGDRKADELAREEHRHREGDIGAVAGAANRGRCA